MMAEAMTNVESALAVSALGISQGAKVLGSIRGGNPSTVNDNGQQQETLVERKEASLQDEEGINILKKINEKLARIRKYFSEDTKVDWNGL